MNKDWPIYFKNQLALGNIESPVGIVTLWTKKDAVLNGVDSSLFAAAGQLYSKEGINWIIRNVLANPRIRYLVLCGGNELSHKARSGEALIDFVKNGVDEESRTKEIKVRIDEEIGREALEKLRQSVEVVDMRHIQNGAEVAEKIKTLDLKKSPFGEPLVFPVEKREAADIFPTDPSIHKLRYPTVAACWPWILKSIMKFGTQKGTDYGGTQRELMNLSAVIYDDDPYNLSFADYFLFSRDEFENYAPQILAPEPVSGTEYTYGERLRNYEGVDQIQGLIDELRRNADSRRAVAVTWKVKQDMSGKQPPCIVSIQGLAQRGALHLTVVIRSNDMVKAWPQNALALRRLQGIVAKETDLKIGALTTVSVSAHIYESDYALAQEIAEKYATGPRCEFDPKGNFVVMIENGFIKVVHQSPQGEHLNEYLGRSATELMLKLDEDLIVSQTGHALYLGSELAKAEICLRQRMEYRQDEPVTKLLNR